VGPAVNKLGPGELVAGGGVGAAGVEAPVPVLEPKRPRMSSTALRACGATGAGAGVDVPPKIWARRSSLACGGGAAVVGEVTTSSPSRSP
jgi:hypothetical protein